VNLPLQPLPHAYPFRFVDRELRKTGPASGSVRAAITANARRVEAGVALAPLTLAELIAQAALLLQGGDPELGRSGFLAGFSDLQVHRLPEPGDVLTVEVTMAGRLGPVVKFDGSITDDSGRAVASGGITVRQGTPRTPAAS
jgi:3-hydroxymyristoyl/3-hydroxydecanoyl-(acyl carrier protein) dehydratase